MQSDFAISQHSFSLTSDEWIEMQALKRAISEYPASVHPSRMERFTKLFTKNLVGFSNTPMVS